MIYINREILGDLTLLTKPKFRHLVNRVVRLHERQEIDLREGLVGEIVAEWEEKRELQGSPAIGTHPLRDSLTLTPILIYNGAGPYDGMAGY